MENDVKLNQNVTVTIKGIREGLLIKLTPADWDSMQFALIKTIEEKESFFKGAKIAIDIGPAELHVTEISSLRDQLSDMKISLWAILSESPITAKTAMNFGYRTEIKSLQTEQQVKPIDTVMAGEQAVMVKRTLRSGFKVNYSGHVVVMGDVNPGAEIVASGSVIIWGKLRGVVHAGAEGDEDAVVCALDLVPTQLRIASQVAIVPSKKRKVQPEMVFIKNGQVIAEPWKK